MSILTTRKTKNITITTKTRGALQRAASFIRGNLPLTEAVKDDLRELDRLSQEVK